MFAPRPLLPSVWSSQRSRTQAISYRDNGRSREPSHATEWGVAARNHARGTRSLLITPVHARGSQMAPASRSCTGGTGARFPLTQPSSEAINCTSPAVNRAIGRVEAQTAGSWPPACSDWSGTTYEASICYTPLGSFRSSTTSQSRRPTAQCLLGWKAKGTDKTFGAHLTSHGSLRLFALVTLPSL